MLVSICQSATKEYESATTKDASINQGIPPLQPPAAHPLLLPSLSLALHAEDEGARLVRQTRVKSRALGDALDGKVLFQQRDTLLVELGHDISVEGEERRLAPAQEDFRVGPGKVLERLGQQFDQPARIGQVRA